MKLDLSEIARNIGMQATQKVEEACSPEELDLDCVSPIEGEIKFMNAGSLLLAKGKVSTEVRLQCSRCVTDFVIPIEAGIEEQFRIEKVGDSIMALPMDEEEATAHLVSNNILDMQELIRQNLLTAVPIQPLCRPDCKGLCPTCGENLNVRQCVCPPEEPESPFLALAELLEDEEKG